VVWVSFHSSKHQSGYNLKSNFVLSSGAFWISVHWLFVYLILLYNLLHYTITWYVRFVKKICVGMYVWETGHILY
jgi:hypothetical protein